MLDLSKISVVLPSLDPDEKLIRVVDGLLEQGFTDIILVNDGSKAENLHYFTDLAAQHPEIHLLHHEVNKGKGAALKNAFRYFLENRPDGYGVVTVDGDDQHHPEDTRRCCEQMMQSGNIVLGCRDFNQADVPARSSFGNKTTSLIFKIFVGMTISDTQTGLRAIPREQLKAIAEIAGDRFEYETNMLLAMKQNGMAYEEVKIRTVYIEENKSSHFRVIHDSWRIYKLILKHFFRYTLSSVACFVLDALGVFLLTKLLHGLLNDPLLGTVATVGARAASSLVNFFLNQKLVFQTNVSTGKAMLRYYALALPQLAVQALLNQGIYSLFSVGEEAAALRTLIHVLVMCVLFIVSYTIQQRWVFAPEKNKK
ncbi:MAG: bifunctional glycosyltransferase family 2/GtrA family protein [Oscillospiraceae bacterium]|nr:bifunctional glycosyltransferase family 2/GtrA family protein [Oscillospiraceae bacterium]